MVMRLIESVCMAVWFDGFERYGPDVISARDGSGGWPKGGTSDTVERGGRRRRTGRPMKEARAAPVT